MGDKTGTWDIHVFKSNLSWAVKLQTWDEAGVVAEGTNGKSGNRGIEMMLIGYASNRESDSVRMWDPSTNGVVTTHDVIWMKRMYYTCLVDAVFDVKFPSLDTDATDVEDIIETNVGSDVEEAGENISGK